jgi:hypothetical protein
MGSLSDYFENKVVAHVFSGVAWTPPVTWYASLFTVAPGEAGGGMEVTAGGYARMAFTCTTAGSVASNALSLEFPMSMIDHGSVVAVGVHDLLTGGNLCAYHVLAVPLTYNANETIRIPAGQLTLALD